MSIHKNYIYLLENETGPNVQNENTGLIIMAGKFNVTFHALFHPHDTKIPNIPCNGKDINKIFCAWWHCMYVEMFQFMVLENQTT